MNLTMEVRARREEFHELYQTLHALLPTLRKEDGCRAFRIFRDGKDGEVFFLLVSWDDVDSLEHYMRSISGSALLGAVDLLSETARVRMGADAQWEGIDMLKRIRTGSYR